METKKNFKEKINKSRSSCHGFLACFFILCRRYHSCGDRIHCVWRVVLRHYRFNLSVLFLFFAGNLFIIFRDYSAEDAATGAVYTFRVGSPVSTSECASQNPYTNVCLSFQNEYYPAGTYDNYELRDMKGLLILVIITIIFRLPSKWFHDCLWWWCRLW